MPRIPSTSVQSDGLLAATGQSISSLGLNICDADRGAFPGSPSFSGSTIETSFISDKSCFCGDRSFEDEGSSLVSDQANVPQLFNRLSKKQREAYEQPSFLEYWRYKFKVLDEHGTGFLDSEKALRSVAQLFPSVQQDLQDGCDSVNVPGLIAACDKNSDGRLSQDEFLNLVKCCQAWWVHNGHRRTGKHNNPFEVKMLRCSSEPPVASVTSPTATVSPAASSAPTDMDCSTNNNSPPRPPLPPPQRHMFPDRPGSRGSDVPEPALSITPSASSLSSSIVTAQRPVSKSHRQRLPPRPSMHSAGSVVPARNSSCSSLKPLPLPRPGVLGDVTNTSMLTPWRPTLNSKGQLTQAASESSPSRPHTPPDELLTTGTRPVALPSGTCPPTPMLARSRSDVCLQPLTLNTEVLGSDQMNVLHLKREHSSSSSVSPRSSSVSSSRPSSQGRSRQSSVKARSRRPKGQRSQCPALGKEEYGTEQVNALHALVENIGPGRSVNEMAVSLLQGTVDRHGDRAFSQELISNALETVVERRSAKSPVAQSPSKSPAMTRSFDVHSIPTPARSNFASRATSLIIEVVHELEKKMKLSFTEIVGQLLWQNKEAEPLRRPPHREVVEDLYWIAEPGTSSTIIDMATCVFKVITADDGGRMRWRHWQKAVQILQKNPIIRPRIRRKDIDRIFHAEAMREARHMHDQSGLSIGHRSFLGLLVQMAEITKTHPAMMFMAVGCHADSCSLEATCTINYN